MHYPCIIDIKLGSLPKKNKVKTSTDKIKTSTSKELGYRIMGSQVK